MARNIVPRTDKGADIGTPTKRWNNVYTDKLKATVVDGDNLGAVEQSAGDEVTLRSLITNAGSNPTSITIYNDIPITTTDLTIPSNVYLRFKDDGKLSPQDGITVIINGIIEAGLYQIFNCIGTGQISFENGNTKIVYPEWWGAVGNETTDDGPVIKRCIDSLSPGLEVIFKNRYLVSKQEIYGVFRVTKDDITLRFIGNAGFKCVSDFIPPDTSGFMFTMGEETIEHKNLRIIGGDFDGDYVNQTSANFGILFLNTKNLLVENVYIHDFNGSGLTLRTNSEGTVRTSRFYRNQIHGIETSGDGTGNCYHVIEDCIFDSQGQLGIDVGDFRQAEKWAAGCDYSVWTNNTIIRNCIFKDNYTNIGKYAQIKISNFAYTLVSGCVFSHTTADIKYHMQISDTYMENVEFGDKVIIENCVFRDDLPGSIIFNEGKVHSIHIINNEFMGGIINVERYIIIRSPGLISGNRFYDKCINSYILCYSSNIQIINNYFEINSNAPICSYKTDLNFDMTINIENFILNNNIIKFNANIDNTIVISTSLNTTMKNINIQGNIANRGDYSCNYFVRIIGQDAGSGANSIINGDISGNLVAGAYGSLVYVSGQDYISNVHIHDNTPAYMYLFDNLDATPSVLRGSIFKTQNTGPTTISNFTHGVNGKKIMVHINDNNTTFDFTSSGLKGNGGIDWTASAGDYLIAEYYITIGWVCTIIDATP